MDNTFTMLTKTFFLLFFTFRVYGQENAIDYILENYLFKKRNPPQEITRKKQKTVQAKKIVPSPPTRSPASNKSKSKNKSKTYQSTSQSIKQMKLAKEKGHYIFQFGQAFFLGATTERSDQIKRAKAKILDLKKRFQPQHDPGLFKTVTKPKGPPQKSLIGLQLPRELAEKIDNIDSKKDSIERENIDNKLERDRTIEEITKTLHQQLDQEVPSPKAEEKEEKEDLMRNLRPLNISGTPEPQPSTPVVIQEEKPVKEKDEIIPVEKTERKVVIDTQEKVKVDETAVDQKKSDPLAFEISNEFIEKLNGHKEPPNRVPEKAPKKAPQSAPDEVPKRSPAALETQKRPTPPTEKKKLSGRALLDQMYDDYLKEN